MPGAAAPLPTPLPTVCSEHSFSFQPLTKIWAGALRLTCVRCGGDPPISSRPTGPRRYRAESDKLAAGEVGLRLLRLVGVWELRCHGAPTRSGLRGAGTAVTFAGNGRGDAVRLLRAAALGASSAFASRCHSVSLAAKAVGAARLSRLLARSRRSRHPPTLHMVLEALQAQDGKKGASVVAIKRFILTKYPTVDPVRLKYLLKRALATGLSRGFLVRPHNSSALGATGRFKVSGAAGAGLGLGAAAADCSHVLPLPCSQLAPKRLQQKQTLGQEDPGEGPAPKMGRRGAAEAVRAPAVVRSDGGQGNGRRSGCTPP